MALLTIDSAQLTVRDDDGDVGPEQAPIYGRAVPDASRLMVAGEAVDVSAYHVLPGLVNSHDHLHLNAFPASPCRAPYAHADDWVADMAARIESEAFLTLRAIPEGRRAWHGALKNALAGTTTVVHHDPWQAEFDDADFPVTVVPAVGWAHSISLAGRYGPEVATSFAATPAGRPWFIHLAEGTDARAAAELDHLVAAGCLRARTRLVHGVGLGPHAWRRIAEAGAAVVLCPSANTRLLGNAARDVFGTRIRDFMTRGEVFARRPGRPANEHSAAPPRLALGTDSRLTGARDLLDELRFAAAALRAADSDERGRGEAWQDVLLHLVTEGGGEVAGRPAAGRLADGAPADLVVLPPRGSAAASLVRARRRDVVMVWSRGRLVMAAPEFAWLFEVTGEPCLTATLDGQPKAIATRVVEPALVGGLSEPGLRIERSATTFHLPTMAASPPLGSRAEQTAPPRSIVGGPGTSRLEAKGPPPQGERRRPDPGGNGQPVDVLLATSFFMALDPKQAQKARPFPPLATLYAASVLRRAGWRVALYDAMLEPDESSFAAALDRHAPRFVALFEDNFNFLTKMCLSRMRQAALAMVSAAKARGLPVVAAGSDASDHPPRFLAAGADAVLIGEAEWTLAELVARWLGSAAVERSSERDGPEVRTPATKTWSDIPGVAWLDEAGVVVQSAARLPEREPDRFPSPAWDLVDIEAYREVWRRNHGHFMLNLATTRGCPYHCNWCAKPIWGQRYAMRSPDAVADEMAYVKERLHPDRIWFADDIFGLRPEWTAAFGEAVMRRGAQIPFQIQCRVDLVSEAAAEGLAKAGCTEVWLGVESGSQAVLDAMEKGIALTEVPDVVARLRKRGIRVCFFIQLGYTGEGWPEIIATRDLIRCLLPDEIGVSVSYPLPGTRFFERVAGQLNGDDHWHDSQDLAMLFQGTFDTATYRTLHDLLHEDLELHRRLASAWPDGGRLAHGGGTARRPADRAAAAALLHLEEAWRTVEAACQVRGA